MHACGHLAECCGMIYIASTRHVPDYLRVLTCPAVCASRKCGQSLANASAFHQHKAEAELLYMHMPWQVLAVAFCLLGAALYNLRSTRFL